jgi:iron complex transport system substrate-binding protein
MTVGGHAQHRGLTYFVFLVLLLLHQVAFAGTAPRVVSLSPSNTELVYSLDAQNTLIGRCNQCDYPPQCKNLEVAGSFVSANAERLVRLKPDLVLTVSGQESMTNAVQKLGFRVTQLSNNRLSEISNNLRTLGGLLNQPQRGTALAAKLDTVFNELSTVVHQAKSQPSVFFCVWPDPLLTVGSNSFLHDCITKCGGTNIAADTKTPYPHYSLERLLLKNPDVIILPAASKQSRLESRAPWNSLKAFRDKRVFYLPEPRNDLLSRPTLRIIPGLSWLAARLHPELAAQLSAWEQRSALQLR